MVLYLMNIYESIIKNSNIIMFIVNPDGIVIDTNRYTRELLEDNSIEGKYFYSLVNEHSVVDIRAILLQKQGSHLETDLKMRCGRMQPALLNISVIDNFMFIIGFTKDHGAEETGLFISPEDKNEIVENENKEKWQLDNIDPVTGLFNKGYFIRVFRHFYDKAIRTGANIGIICFDVQGFDSILNNQGEDKANSILRGFSQVILKSVRGTDFVVRYDNRFVLLVNNGNEDVLKKISDRIRNEAYKNVGVFINAAQVSTANDSMDDGRELIKMVFEKIENLLEP